MTPPGGRVTGGAYAIEARTEDMRATAAHCEDIAGHTRKITSTAVGEDLALAAVPGSVLAPHTLASVAGRIAGFELRGQACAASTAALAQALDMAAGAYERADRAAQEAPGRILHLLGLVTGAGLVLGAPARAFSPVAAAWTVVGAAAAWPWRPGTPAGRAAGRAAGGWATAGEILEHFVPGVVRGLTILGPDIPGTPFARERPRDGADLAELLLLLARARGLMEKSGLEVHEVPASHTDPVEPPASLTELFNRTAQQNKRRGGTGAPNPRQENGEVRVEEILHPDGTRSWIVHVPATTEWDPGRHDAPTDLASNAEAVAGHETQAMRLVREAMERAGIAPGEEVLMAGHSQGGRTALGLLEDEEFLARFNVTAVVTVGSPVATVEVPPEVEVLSIQHADDPVPFLDGGQNPGRAHWTTVTVEAPTGTPPRTGGEAHRSSAYEESIRGLEDLGEGTAAGATVGEFLRRHRRFFSGRGGRAREFYGRRRYPTPNENGQEQDGSREHEDGGRFRQAARARPTVGG